MRPSSNISSSLSKKRRKSFIKKLILFIVLILCLFFTFVLAIRWEGSKIKNIRVSGNTTVSQIEILGVINTAIAKKYLWLIPTDNFFLLRRPEIETQLLNNIYKLQSVKVSVSGLYDLEVSVSEREPASLWCAGTPTLSESCFTMDKDGLIFEPATTTVGKTTKYFGLITDANPLGKAYFTNHFRDASNFFDTIVKMNLSPESFYAVTDGEYEIHLLYGGKILANSKKTFEEDMVNLKAVIDAGYIKTDVTSLQKIKYIDLRYGNKAILNFN